MKASVLCSITLLAVAPAFAQTGATQPTDPANKTVTLTGCVGSSANSSGFTLGNAMVVPGTPQPGQIDQTPSPMPPTVSPTPTPTQVGAAAPAPPATVPPPAAASPAQVPPPASVAQVPPPASPAQVPPPTAAGTAAVGTAGTTPPTVTGTSGIVTGGAAANVTSGLGGYRLSGADMSSWSGQRVQVIGTFAPSAPTAAGTTAVGQSGTPTAPQMEFRVQSVQPMSGPCPK